jgi:hypothetical protein
MRIMSGDLEPLVLDLVEWVAREPRSYAEVFDTWRTSCPRLPVWEEACDRGLVARENAPGRSVLVVVTPAGRRFLQLHGRRLPPSSEAVRQAAE